MSSSPELVSSAAPSGSRIRVGPSRPRSSSDGVRLANLFVLGAGVVGSHVLSQVAELPPQTRPPFVGLRTVGVATRRGGVFDLRGLAAGTTAAFVAERRAAGPSLDTPLEVPALTTHLDTLARLPDTVLVDCTAADGMERVYVEALRRGIHVVTANKKPLVAAHDEVERVFRAAAASGASFRYEATVGAGLPVIGTLQGLVRTGDRIRTIACALSGTLGYLVDELGRGVPLSRAVETAKALGYTEPDPREDLAGTDVARKAVILARELGLPLSLEDVALTPLVPREVLDAPGELLENLAAHDEAFARKVAALAAAGKKLTYLARVHAGDAPGIEVGPVAVEAHHPAASLDGPTGLVSFSTDRYPDAPLVVRGSGAGGAVTASAVLSDVFLCLSGKPAGDIHGELGHGSR